MVWVETLPEGSRGYFAKESTRWDEDKVQFVEIGSI
jgi:hypothetical protein